MTMSPVVSPPALEIDPAEIDLVYSAACRQVRDAHLAEDVTQGVFLLLRRKHPLLPRGGAEGRRAGWLIKTTCFVSKTAIRQASRRRKHEQKAAAMAPILQPAAGEDADWATIAGQLDAALAALGESDRSAVVLRYLQNKPLKEVAGALGFSESGAGKRVGRALKKLRAELAARGVTASTAGLSAMLPLRAVVPAPAELAAAVRSGHGSPAGTALSQACVGTFAAIKTVAAVGVVVGLTAGVIWLGTILYRATSLAPIAMPAPAATASLRLTIIDPDTKAPLPGVQVAVRIDQRPQDYVTDEKGVCAVELPVPPPQDILIRAHQAGRVPMKLWWPNYASSLHGGLPSGLYAVDASGNDDRGHRRG
jgi:RNA polymerase sigma factor (sigma-70 family)